ncbi:MAG TPA: hypothetical protein DD435_07825 [Cyanobacteria bacterium UBA8530]|nr:hypothetical protein [Cyanobacteria bacterium UBA8530]
MQRDWQIPVTLVALTVGLLLSTQFKSQADIRRSVPSRRVEDLQVLLRTTEEIKDNLAKEVSELRLQLREQGKDLPQKQLPSWWTALKGPGIEIHIDDSSKPLKKGEDPNTAIVHNDDLLRLTNELRSGGSEAIAINDQRLIDSSEIACAGSTILVNRSRIIPPFVVRAIGDQDTLDAALRMRGGIVDYLQFYGIQVTISKKAEVVVPMYRGGNALKLAKPADRP